MQYIAVLAAAAGSYAFGAMWYMMLSRQWIAASGVACDENGKPLNSSATPFIVSGIAMILVAGMMRHIFVMAQMSTLIEGIMGGFGIGLFLVVPWIVTNYAYSDRPRALMLIDGGYAVAGCTIMGIILALFGL